ncbi:hypothetical protein C8J56DRAFT_896231 [Mycena floridula]|nr:hypothetical protein C8J56DRAFT_896231 [Mycena floridula]
MCSNKRKKEYAAFQEDSVWRVQASLGSLKGNSNTGLDLWKARQFIPVGKPRLVQRVMSNVCGFEMDRNMPQEIITYLVEVGKQSKCSRQASKCQGRDAGKDAWRRVAKRSKHVSTCFDLIPSEGYKQCPNRDKAVQASSGQTFSVDAWPLWWPSKVAKQYSPEQDKFQVVAPFIWWPPQRKRDCGAKCIQVYTAFGMLNLSRMPPRRRDDGASIALELCKGGQKAREKARGYENTAPSTNVLECQMRGFPEILEFIKNENSGISSKTRVPEFRQKRGFRDSSKTRISEFVKNEDSGMSSKTRVPEFRQNRGFRNSSKTSGFRAFRERVMVEWIELMIDMRNLLSQQWVRLVPSLNSASAKSDELLKNRRSSWKIGSALGPNAQKDDG